MGRPKLSNLFCTICKTNFKRKWLLDEHMKNHSSSKQLKKSGNIYCHVCKKSFEPESYKSHLQTEHQFDFHNKKSNDAKNLFSCESGFVLLSKMKLNKKNDVPQQQPVAVSEIKIEAADSEDSDWSEQQKAENKKSMQKEILKVKLPKLECSVCGMQCKGERGLKIHMSAHKRNSSCNDDSESKDSESNDFSQSLADKTSNSFSNNPSVQQPVAVKEIKVEVAETEDYDCSKQQKAKNKKSVQKNILKVRFLKLKCSVCGMKCKGERGLKIHMSAHNRHNSFNVDSKSKNCKIRNRQSLTDKISNSSSNNKNTHVLLANNTTVNSDQSVKTNIRNFPFQNNKFQGYVISANQPNVQSLQSLSNQTIQQPDAILKFDSNSKKYAKWLKNFISTCKMHSYPLNPELCKKIKLVTKEVCDALSCPELFKMQKENHFYFMRMYDTLSEIMLKHLQHVICDAKN